MYFPARDCSFRIDHITAEILREGLRRSLEEAANTLVASGRFPEELARPRLEEAVRLRSAGFMERPEFRLPLALKERQLERRFNSERTGLELALAETCNLACEYCYCSSVRDMPGQGLMTQDVAKKAIDWLFEASGELEELKVLLFGGEPLLNKPVFRFVMDYSDALAKAHGKRIHYSMTTNGTLLDDTVIHYIKKHNFGLMVSMDGPPEIHDAQCPTKEGNPSFEMAAQGIRRLMKRRKRVTVRCTMTSARPNMLELIKFFEAFGFTRIALGQAHSPRNPSPVDCTREDAEDFARQQESELLPWMQEQLEQGRIPIWFPFNSIFTDPEPDPDSVKVPSMFHCGACRGTMTVGADGKLYPCHRFVGMRSFVIGHIDTGPDVESAKNFWRRYDAAVDTRCSRCWARHRCNRPCPWHIARKDGSFEMPAESECAAWRESVEKSIHYRWHLAESYPAIRERLHALAEDKELLAERSDKKGVRR